MSNDPGSRAAAHDAAAKAARDIASAEARLAGINKVAKTHPTVLVTYCHLGDKYDAMVDTAVLQQAAIDGVRRARAVYLKAGGRKFWEGI